LVYFGATKSDENLGDELWRSDGTSPGTVQIKDIYPGSQGAHPHNFFGVEDRVYFAADDGSHGEELWISDGTETGTTLVADIVPGLGSSDPRPLATYKNYLIFSADDEIHGEEMWITDGTPGGTRLLLDFYDGPDGSNPGPVVFLDGDMIVYVDHPDYGRELWKIDASVLPVAVEEGLNVAHDFRLFENYPNPFNPTTTISYSLALPGNVELKVYNVIGELVKTLENRVLPAGEHSTSFNASGLSSGVYFYTLTAGHLTETRKMILLK